MSLANSSWIPAEAANTDDAHFRNECVAISCGGGNVTPDCSLAILCVAKGRVSACWSCSRSQATPLVVVNTGTSSTGLRERDLRQCRAGSSSHGDACCADKFPCEFLELSSFIR